MATHSSIFAWEIPWTEEPHGLQSTGWQRVGYSEQLSMHTTQGKIYLSPQDFDYKQGEVFSVS